MYDTLEIARLIKKKWDGEITSKERLILENWAKENEENMKLLELIRHKDGILDDVLQWLELRQSDDSSSFHERLERNTMSKIEATKVIPLPTSTKELRGSKSNFMRLLPYAAVVIAILVAGVFFLPFGKQDTKIVVLNDLEPGTNKAVITLSDGKTIELSEDQEGVVVGSQLTYSDGSLVSELNNGEDLLAVLQTPKGGSYQIKLADGTKVWLNADSKLTYPVKFNRDARVVTLDGEAYFEVTKNESHGHNIPFIVKANQQEIEVLGTSFNVMAYHDEPLMQTTLTRGKVNVKAAGKEILLNPGEQSQATTQSLDKRAVDTDQYLAWINDEFIFNETELKEALRTLSRWYDFEVVYEGSTPAATYLYGNISRKKGLADVLKIMEASGLQFRIEKSGNVNKVIVLK